MNKRLLLSVGSALIACMLCILLLNSRGRLGMLPRTGSPTAAATSKLSGKKAMVRSDVSESPRSGDRVKQPRRADHSRVEEVNALRGLSGQLTSDTLGTSTSADGKMLIDSETSETRAKRWKDLGLQIVPIRIIDETSQPIPGVKLLVDGVHMGQTLGKRNTHRSWDENRHGPAPEALTNSEGRAILASPVIMSELMMATGISISASKSGYATRRIHLYPVDGTERDEVLQSGNTLILGAYAGEKSNRIFEFKPALSFSANLQEDSWRAMGDGRFIVDAVPDGSHVISAEHNENGILWLSDFVELKFAAGKTLEYDIELKPSLELKGQLSSNVPRPVKAGKIVACAMWPPPGPRSRKGDSDEMRKAEAEINEDGTFEVKGLPSGPGEIIGLCEGFIASHISPNAPIYEQNQRYDLPRNNTEPMTLQMEETGKLRVKTESPDGNPLPGIMVSASPNVGWGTGAAQMYIDFNVFTVETDSGGFGIVSNLRAGRTSYRLYSQEWTAPINVRDGEIFTDFRAEIAAGQTTEATVIMQPSASK